MVVMDTTIQISGELLQKLKNMKIYSKESYENVIWDLIEDRLEFSSQTKTNIKNSERDLIEGRTVSLEEIKRKFGV